MSDADELISAWLDGELDDDGQRRLDAWLAADHEHQRRFLLLVMDHRVLAERAEAERFQSIAHDARAPRARRGRAEPSPWRGRVLGGALAAGLALAVAGAWTWWRAHPDASARTPEAVIDSAIAATLTRAGIPQPIPERAVLHAGDRLVVADGGAAAVRYDDGTVVRLDGGSEAWFEAADGAKRVRLAHGRLAAEVARQPTGHPAVFATPEAEVAVLGTALAVTSAGGETLAEVSHGRVAVTRLADRARVEVAAGEYALAATGSALAARPAGAPAGRTYAVGAGLAFPDLAALPPLAPGDVVEIHPGRYRGGQLWKAGGTALRPITLRGVGDGPALIDGDGVGLSGVGAEPRALFQVHGDHYVVERLDFVNARNHEGAAGIRCVGTRGTVIRRCRVTRCDVGIDAIDDDLLIEDCEVGWCGTPERDGDCHELHLGGDRAVVRGCDIHDALHGQALKGASRHLELRGNRFTAAADGEISFAVAAGAGARDCDVAMIANLVAGKPGRAGNIQRFIAVERDHGGLRHGILYLIGNTFVAGDARTVFVSTAQSAMAVVADGNIFSGSLRIANLDEAGMSGRGNWLPPGAQTPAGLGTGAAGAAPGFIAPERGDYHLRGDSPCLGRGVDGSVYRDALGRLQPARADLEPGADLGTIPLPPGAQRRIGAFSAR
jgi:ferric-dicitrate binding protein FerR (iron transport regulator)